MHRPSAGMANPQLSTKEPAHLSLHRRSLFPTLSPDKPLPALVPGRREEIALLNEKCVGPLSFLHPLFIRRAPCAHSRIYHLIALALRAYVLTWLPRITRDRSLLPHIHQDLLAPILTPIFASIASDPDSLVPLILHDLPGVLVLHIKTYWTARETSRILHEPLDKSYHSVLPLLSTEPAGPQRPPEEGRNAVPEGQYVLSGLWLTAFSDSVAKLYLPEKEYQVDVQRTMVRELIGRTVLGGVGRRLVEGWFWYGLILRLLPSPKPLYKATSPRSLAENSLSIAYTVISGFWKIWAVGTWIAASLTAAPASEHKDCASSWLELARVILGVDGRLGKRNWALRLAWGLIEMVMVLFSPLLDR